MQPASAGFRRVSDAEAQRANRADWDREADEYQREHASFLRDVGFVWCPEALDEGEARLLGDVAGLRVLEVGCGAGQCARWLTTQDADVVGVDISMRQLQHSLRIDAETGLRVPVAAASVTALPFASSSFDLACSAFGALPFVVDISTGLAEVRRVLRPGGRFAFSVVHPARRMFPDDPSERGMTIVRSYFDRSAYVEEGDDGRASYVEPHHTLGDWVDAIVAAGLDILRLVEPQWPPELTREWGGWGPVRGSMLPGTVIFAVRRPAG
jgi:SAM-dependent methyltransferase